MMLLQKIDLAVAIAGLVQGAFGPDCALAARFGRGGGRFDDAFPPCRERDAHDFGFRPSGGVGAEAFRELTLRRQGRAVMAAFRAARVGRP